MKNLSSIEIVNKFLVFFEKNDHLRIDNSSIVPKNDPTLLFINSGMAPIKNYFTGIEKPKYPKLCNVQPCVRTNDIESIGDKHHLTSFQMLGSWSINNYFKEQAIILAFDFLTNVLEIPPRKLYVTIFGGSKILGLGADHEARDFWLKSGILKGHIVECGAEDNFWGPASITGPCGPCTEVFYDTSDEPEILNMVAENFDTKNRFIEIWNAGVFMQFNKNADGSFSKLNFTSVDTGAGLERLAMVLGNHDSVYETDLLKPIKKAIEDGIGTKKIPKKDVLIITDHMRTIALILSEKVASSNEGRGYIPRKLIRRCMMIIKKNHLNDFNFFKILVFIIKKYAEFFPKFKANKKYILNEFEKEQNQFDKILTDGLEKLKIIKDQSNNFNSEDIFNLVTTHGLPFDIIKDFANESGIQIDEMGFNEKVKAHRELSKGKIGVMEQDSKINIELEKFLKTDFLGYEAKKSKSKILSIFEKENELVIVADKTPMYAESGGQISDTGFVFNEKFKGKIKDIKKSKNGVFMHFVEILKGSVNIGDEVIFEVDEARSKKITCNHSAAHLLHSVLRKIFGKSVHQAGSKIEENKLRFDFNYENAISDDEIIKIENLVNSYIKQNFESKIEIKSLNEAIRDGASALFESKYEDEVRVVSFGDISKELCGGTHVKRTGDIGLFLIISTEGIGKGIRRITAITGDEALSFIQNMRCQVNNISKILKVKANDIVSRIEKEFIGNKETKITAIEISKNEIKDINKNFSYISRGKNEKKIGEEALKIAESLNKVLVCILGEKQKQIVVATPEKLVNRYSANEILKSILKKVDGKGGGNKKIANGGALSSFEEILAILNEIAV